MSAAPAKIELPSEEKEILESISKLGDKVSVVFSKPNRIKISVSRENILEVAKYLREQTHFDQIANVTGTDFPKDKQLEITYHLGAIDYLPYRRIILAMTCRIPSADPLLPSLIEVYPSANYYERETTEMIGCTFQGHPNLSRFLLPEDWNDIPPMLKAYRLPGRLEAE
ncbi:MAG: NADH-quinone oxidoreductase subunit C [Thaumarchaeota archaeon]|nr:NADH-quinone oxidoreductase subunit C [Nitrososphaerota archaeon]